MPANPKKRIPKSCRKNGSRDESPCFDEHSNSTPIL